MSVPLCPHCSVGLQEGFILDHTRNARSVSRWVAGKPEASFWLGLNLKGRMNLEVAAHRCPRCGYLALFASGAGVTH